MRCPSCRCQGIGASFLLPVSLYTVLPRGAPYTTQTNGRQGVEPCFVRHTRVRYSLRGMGCSVTLEQPRKLNSPAVSPALFAELYSRPAIPSVEPAALANHPQT